MNDYSISNKHLIVYCQPGTSNTCAYLSVGPSGWECCKTHPGMKAIIDKRLAEGTIRSTGDNCNGPNKKRIVN